MVSATWYFDLVSPFAALALPEVEALGCPVRFRPVVLGALLGHWGTLGPAEVPPKRLHTYRLAQFGAAEAGIPLRFPPRHPFRSLDALRLLAAAEEPSAAAVRAAFRFVWGEGRDPSDPDELPALAARLGLDPAAASAGRDRLRGWTETAAAAGVFGVPTLMIGSELFWGADAMPMARAFLADPAIFGRGEMARLGGLPVGVERRRGA
jgi:2-hydroxychromene-2-carboxylate isomerase